MNILWLEYEYYGERYCGELINIMWYKSPSYSKVERDIQGMYQRR